MIDARDADSQDSYWWLSFADSDGPGGFLGACIVVAPDFGVAVQVAWAAGCNPGGQVKGTSLSCQTDADLGGYQRNRLYSRAEMEEHEP